MTRSRFFLSFINIVRRSILDHHKYNAKETKKNTEIKYKMKLK